MVRAYPVDVVRRKKKFDERVEANRHAVRLCTRFRQALRLYAPRRCVQFRLPNVISHDTVPDAVHRFEESIGGRPYVIEVAAVANNRWRAYIVRIPAVPTALMPFYGGTPVEAARLLCDWLTRAHARASNPSPTV